MPDSLVQPSPRLEDIPDDDYRGTHIVFFSNWRWWKKLRSGKIVPHGEWNYGHKAQLSAVKVASTAIQLLQNTCPFGDGAHVIEVRMTSIGNKDVCLNCGYVVHYS